MEFKDHFSRLAAQYAAFRPHYPPDLFAFLAGLCPRRTLAWDCACGNGQASVGLAEHFDHVLATDASADQVAAAEPHPGISYRSARAESSGLDAGSAELVTVAQALHWFDLDAFYREVDRVLVPGGVLAVWCYGVMHIDGHAADEIFQKFYYHHPVHQCWPPERQWVEEGYRSLAFPYRELVPPAFQMSASWSLPQLLGYVRSWSAVSRYSQQHGRDPVTDLESELSQAWGDAQAPRAISWPVMLRAGIKPLE